MREQDRHAFAVLAAAVTDDHKRAPVDQFLAFGGNGELRQAAERRNAAHAFCPSWSVIFIAGVRLTKSGRTS